MSIFGKIGEALDKGIETAKHVVVDGGSVVVEKAKAVAEAAGEYVDEARDTIAEKISTKGNDPGV